jgi:hypothetical protein
MEEQKELSVEEIAVLAAKIAREINEKAGNNRGNILHVIAGLLGFKIEITWGF